MKRLLYLLFPSLLLANPHFFVDTNLNIDKNKLQFDWKFDRINSALLFFEADKNKDKIIDKSEEKEMIDKLFLPLRDDNYFIVLQQDDDMVAKPENVRFLYLKKRVHIQFDIFVKNFTYGVVCNIDPVVYFAFKLKDVKSNLGLKIQKDRYDFCIGVGE